LDPKTHTADDKAGLARTNALTRITEEVQKQLTSKYTPLRKESVGYLYVTPKSNIVQLWTCSNCEAQPDPSGPTEKGEASLDKLESHESEVESLGTIVGVWHSHPSDGYSASQPSQPDDIVLPTTVIKAVNTEGVGVIVQKNTITIYPIAPQVPKFKDEETNVPSVNTPTYSKKYIQSGAERATHQYGVFDSNIHPFVLWKR